MKLVWRWVLLSVLALLALQLYFVGRIAAMAVVAPQSTAFERSEAWRVTTEKGELRWRQEWVDYAQISDHLKRAVIASEDDGFSQHDGVDWEALEKAWAKNAKAEQRAEQKKTTKPPKIVGGSTITQQLAKNLFLSGERTLFRKGQEFVLTMMLEHLLTKQRILDLSLRLLDYFRFEILHRLKWVAGPEEAGLPLLALSFSSHSLAWQSSSRSKVCQRSRLARKTFRAPTLSGRTSGRWCSGRCSRQRWR